ncbi:inositol polyphosphate kinase kcs1 [Mucor velutinosus]|uniref:Inositol polyphosphate kinase kcs1 n=1 Tax=Mucor velutinosus TaxID=708070 RepID=A0AAN7D8Q0_9FUNG|nr:inositol polyphosphate kinase kcs1 [Mucor velutinosus]
MTLSTKAERRTIKSWFNLLSTDESLAVNVTDDWFPHTLSNEATNRTWTMYAFLLGHDSVQPLADHASFKLNADANNAAYVSIQVVQIPPKSIVISKEHFPEKWKIALIILAIVVVIIALCIIIWLYKNMQKEKKKAAKAKADAEASLQRTPNNNMNSKMQSSILSTPDAMMIADTFRQVMSTFDIDKHRNQVGEDLLKRQLESEGTSVSEVERRTSSTKQKQAKKLLLASPFSE